MAANPGLLSATKAAAKPIAEAVAASGGATMGVGAVAGAAVMGLLMKSNMDEARANARKSKQKEKMTQQQLQQFLVNKSKILKTQLSCKEDDLKKAQELVKELDAKIATEEKEISQFNVEREDDSIKIIVTMGWTGSGKSTLCNRLMGDTSDEGDGSEIDCEFKTSLGSTSCTETPQKMEMEIGDHKFTVVDTPGYSDSNGKDRKHTNNLCKYLKGCGGINAFVLVRNGTNPRFDAAFQRMLDEYHEMIGDEFFKRLIIVATHIESHAIKQFKKGNKEETLKKDICDKYETEGQEFSISVIPIGFDPGYDESLNKLAQSVPDNKHEFEDVMSPIDDLRAQLADAEEQESKVRAEIESLKAEIARCNRELRKCRRSTSR